MPKRLLHDPREFHIPDSSHNELLPEEIKEMRELFFRRWPPFLSGSEYKIVSFIYDRTINYGKRWEYVSIETLTNGFPLADYRHVLKNAVNDPKFYRNLTVRERQILGSGECFLTAPTGLSRRQIVTSLESLERNGFIFRITNRDLPEMALNPEAHVDYLELILGRKKR